jgi:hypothetical protein
MGKEKKTMIDSSVTKLGAETHSLDDAGAGSSLEYEDDDEGYADCDDEDELAVARPERWSSPSGFGSPEWWSRV